MRHLKRINENFLQEHEGLDDILTELNDIIKPMVVRPLKNNDPRQTGSGSYVGRYSHHRISYDIPKYWTVDDVVKFYNTFKTIVRRIEDWCSNNKVLFTYNCSYGLNLNFTTEDD